MKKTLGLFAVVMSLAVYAAGAGVLSQEDVLKLLQLQISEATIIDKVKASGTAFVLGADDVARLRKAGATAALIAAMQASSSTAGAVDSHTSEITDLVLIVDYSGSMNARMNDGQTKVTSAKKCVSDLIDRLPGDLNVALIVYGTNKRRGCEDIDIVQPLGPMDKAAMKAKINDFHATGMTPIAASLTLAGQELKKAKGGPAIVLVTDGAETCHGDPSGVATKLAAEFGVKFGIHVVGFGVEPQEKASLADIASKGHGKLVTAENARELADALQRTLAIKGAVAPPPAPSPPAPPRETKQYVVAGTVLKPGAWFDDAPMVKAGEYAGGIAMKEAHYYQVFVRKGQELRAIAAIKKTPVLTNTQLSPLDAPIQQDFNLTVYNANLDVLAREVAKTEDNPTTPVTIRATCTAETDGMVYICVGASINYDHWHADDSQPLLKTPAPSPYSLKIRLEGEVAGAGEAAPAEVLQVKAGNNYQTAGRLPENGIVVGDLKFSETAFYSVPVKKGDVLQVGAAAQKPYEKQLQFKQAKGTYQLTIYDDDQVEVAKKAFDIEHNPPDAASSPGLTWPVALSGKAYIVLSATKADQIADDPKTPPGRFAIQVTAGGASSAAEGGADKAKPKTGKNPFSGVESGNK